MYNWRFWGGRRKMFGDILKDNFLRCKLKSIANDTLYLKKKIQHNQY